MLVFVAVHATLHMQGGQVVGSMFGVIADVLVLDQNSKARASRWLEQGLLWHIV